jgi:hypothetical protein
MDQVFNDDEEDPDDVRRCQTRAMEKPRALRHLAWHLTFERKPDKSVELRGAKGIRTPDLLHAMH